MSLPDVRRLAELPPARFRALGLRLTELGATHQTLAELTGAVLAVPPEQRRALRRLHLRRAASPVADAFRLLFFGDHVNLAQARAALGDELLDALASVGFVERTGDGRVASAYVLALHGPLYVLADDLARGEDAVAGPDGIDLTCSRASIPVASVGAALDFACGSASKALLLAQHASRVVASDPDARAIALARVSAAIGAIDNVDFRVGDASALPAGSFDVIVSRGSLGQREPPPWLSGVAARLAPGGTCVLFSEWADAASAPVSRRLRDESATTALDLLVLGAPSTGIDARVAAQAHARHPHVDDDYARAVVALRARFADRGVETVSPALVVLRRPRVARAGWTATVDVRPFEVLVPSGLRIDRLLSGHDLLHGDDAALLAAELRFPKRTTFDGTRTSVDPAVTPSLAARFSERALVRPHALDAAAFLLLSLVHMSKSVDEAARFTAETWSISLEEARQRLLPPVRAALAAGALEARTS